MKKNAEVRRYSSFADDFVTTKDQDHRLPEDYRWIRTDVRSRFLSALSYGAALVISSVWCRAALHVRLRDRKLLRAARDGAFIYANHTQPVGDVFIPALASFPRRIYTVVSPANLGIPVIGRILPYLGALPIPDTLGGMRGFTEAVKHAPTRAATSLSIPRRMYGNITPGYAPCRKAHSPFRSDAQSRLTP